MMNEVEKYREILKQYEAEVEKYRNIVKQYADMISPEVTKMPPATKYQPKMTLEPFIAAYKAVYSDQDESAA